MVGAGVEMNAGESGKLADGSFEAARLREVELDDLVACDGAGVCDFGFDLDGIAGLDLLREP